jgi:DNA-binding response OmpR family regulator
MIHILLVDDHADTLDVMTRLLAQRGHRVATAASLAAARALCAAQRFDLLICDLKLPDGNGRDLAAVARGCGAKAISMSGAIGADPADPADAIGFDAELTKPISFEQLDATIDRVMRP